MIIFSVPSSDIFEGVVNIMDGSTVVTLNDLEVDYDEDDFDNNWTYLDDTKDDEKAEVLLCL